jgi:hypothetical protein
MRLSRIGSLGLGVIVAVVVAVVVPLSISGPARACGVSTADGLSACSLEEHEEATRPRWHAGASGVYTSTAIQFQGSVRSDETRGAVVASLAYQPSRRTTFQLALGGTFGGRLSTPTGQYDFSPGPTAAVGASWRLLEGARPFVVLTSNLSFSAASTTPSGAGAGGGNSAAKIGYQAFDLRLGALCGMTFFRTLSPYAVGRVFGGPVFWQYQGADVTGGDVHHYQLGAGMTVVVARRLNVFAEGIPLGERSLAAGTAVAF